MKRLVTILLSAIIAISVLAQVQETRAQNPSNCSQKVLWVIDGLAMDTITVASDELVADSIQPWLERYFPIIKFDDINEVQMLKASDTMSYTCFSNDYIILIKTHENSGIK